LDQFPSDPDVPHAATALDRMAAIVIVEAAAGPADEGAAGVN